MKSPRKSLCKVKGKSLQQKATHGDQLGKMGCCVSRVKVKYQIGYMYQIFIKLDAPFVWMALVKYLCGLRMLVLIDVDGLTKGRGLNFQHLGRGAGQVWQVELQVLRQN